MSAAVYLLPAITLLVGLGALPLGRRLGVMDYPGYRHKTHDRPTPLVGGLSVALPLLVYCALRIWDSPDGLVYAALLITIAGAFLMGFFDDRRHLPSLFRLLYGVALGEPTLGGSKRSNSLLVLMTADGPAIDVQHLP